MISIKGESKINFLPYLIFTLVTSCKSLNDLTFFWPFSDSYIQVNLENILYVFSKKLLKLLITALFPPYAPLVNKYYKHHAQFYYYAN